MKTSNDKYWETRQMYLAAYLFARGAVIVGVEADERKATFTFINSLDLLELIRHFRSGTPMVDARIYISALETLKHKAIDALMESHGRK